MGVGWEWKTVWLRNFSVELLVEMSMHIDSKPILANLTYSYGMQLVRKGRNVEEGLAKKLQRRPMLG